MAICGAVLTLCSEPAQKAETLKEIGMSFQEVELGDARLARVPIVIETPDRSSFLSCWNSLLETSGVLDLELAYVHYDAGDGPRPALAANGEDQ